MINPWNKFEERMKRLNPFFMLGKGMNIGEHLNPYVPSILFRTILEVFFREIDESLERDKQSIYYIVQQVVKDMGLEASPEQIERMRNGLLYFGDEKMNRPFEAEVFVPENKAWETQTFRYLVTDEYFTDLESNRKVIYKLSDAAQEMVFMSREITEEYSISVEQLYSIQLIKNGNFRKATDNQTNLIAKVKRFIRDEEMFKNEILQDPRLLVSDENKQRESRRNEIESQFEEESKYFKTMLSLVEKAQTDGLSENVRKELFELQEQVELSRRLHDRFARLVIQNIEIEMRFKTENPSLFWEQSKMSFKETIYEEWVVQKGITDFEPVHALVNSLFSPQHEFILPLEWVWDEQEIIERVFEEDETDVKDEEEEFNREEVDWESVAAAWEPVFQGLLDSGEFSLTRLKELPLDLQDQWFEERITYELWMLFDQSPLTIRVMDEDAWNDEREKLMIELVKRNRKFEQLYGCGIYTEYDPDAPVFHWYGTKMTPFKLKIKEMN
ncbi:hypothetical protein ACTWQB_12060 [Piscibacillus sp. B03]|uniref:hypothetical protein n=1 Tax=Piscibacillus sp. B03 TaxID=3457430 RepID=UPI003FCD26F3